MIGQWCRLSLCDAEHTLPAHVCVPDMGHVLESNTTSDLPYKSSSGKGTERNNSQRGWRMLANTLPATGAWKEARARCRRAFTGQGIKALHVQPSTRGQGRGV